jgi:hypothetical protein
MAAILFVLWVAVCFIAWRNSPKMRAVFPGGGAAVFRAIALETSFWFLLAPGMNLMSPILEERLAASPLMGNMMAGGVLLLVWLALVMVVPQTRRLCSNYMRLISAQITGRDLAQAAGELASKTA